MLVPPQAIKFVCKWEGFAPRAYRDGRGWSIGYGHWSVKRPREVISRARALAILHGDLSRVQRVVLRTAGRVKLNLNELVALDDFTYNVGIGAWLHSTLRKDIILDRMALAANQFGRWVMVDRRVSKDLIARRRAERAIFLTRR